VLTREIASGPIRRHLPEVNQAADALDFLVEDVGLLENYAGRIRFVHSSFFEYFLARSVAEELVQETTGNTALANRWKERTYAEAIIFAVEIAWSEGYVVASVLEAIAAATAFEAKCRAVAALAPFEDDQLYEDE